MMVAAAAVRTMIMMVMMVMIVIVMMMPVVVRMHMAMAAVGVGKRVEWRSDLAHLCAQFPQLVGHAAFAQDQDPLGGDVDGKMMIADVPAEFDQVRGIATGELDELLVGIDDLDRAVVFHNQPVAGAQFYRFDEVDQHLVATRQRQHLAAQVPLVMRQCDRAAGWRGIGRNLG